MSPLVPVKWIKITDMTNKIVQMLLNNHTYSSGSGAGMGGSSYMSAFSSLRPTPLVDGWDPLGPLFPNTEPTACCFNKPVSIFLVACSDRSVASARCCLLVAWNIIGELSSFFCFCFLILLQKLCIWSSFVSKYNSRINSYELNKHFLLTFLPYLT